MDDRKLWAAHFLMVPLCCGVVCASIHSLRESTHVGLTSVAGRWAWSLLAVKAMSVAVGGEWSATLSMPRTILTVVNERSSLPLLGSINSKVPASASHPDPSQPSLSESGGAPPCPCIPAHFGFLV
jgi:hypothetical protein